MLNKFIQAKQKEISMLEQQKTGGAGPQSCQGARPDLIKALSGTKPAIIAEYKRASPSKGVINSSVSASEASDIFFRGKAAACSVLTEEKYFQGDISFLGIFAKNGLPVLRKDFLYHPLQVRQTAATSASALLLIVRVVQTRELLNELVSLSLDHGLEPVVEIFNPEELEMARKAGARVILVNNRDLDRLVVDLNVSRELIKDKDPGETWICASGIERRTQIDEFYRSGFDAFLIGTSIMSSDDPEAKLRELTAWADC